MVRVPCIGLPLVSLLSAPLLFCPSMTVILVASRLVVFSSACAHCPIHILCLALTVCLKALPSPLVSTISSADFLHFYYIHILKAYSVLTHGPCNFLLCSLQHH